MHCWTSLDKSVFLTALKPRALCTNIPITPVWDVPRTKLWNQVPKCIAYEQLPFLMRMSKYVRYYFSDIMAFIPLSTELKSSNTLQLPFVMKPQFLRQLTSNVISTPIRGQSLSQLPIAFKHWLHLLPQTHSRSIINLVTQRGTNTYNIFRISCLQEVAEVCDLRAQTFLVWARRVYSPWWTPDAIVIA